MEIQLTSKLTGFSKGEPCRLQPYVCRLAQHKGGHVLFQVGQPFSSGETGWLGGWRLMTLIQDRVDDEPYLDFGQEWKVKGMRAALKESLRHVKFEFK